MLMCQICSLSASPKAPVVSGRWAATDNSLSIDDKSTRRCAGNAKTNGLLGIGADLEGGICHGAIKQVFAVELGGFGNSISPPSTGDFRL